jgi:alcohol dehydrogenase class IV
VDGVDWLRDTVARLRVPRLSQYGIRPEQADEIVAKAAIASSTQGNPVALTSDEMKAALADAT